MPKIDIVTLKMVGKVGDFTVEAIYEVDDYLGEFGSAVRDENYADLNRLIEDRLKVVKRKASESYKTISRPAADELKSSYNIRYPIENVLHDQYYAEWMGILSELEDYSIRIRNLAKEGDWEEAGSYLEPMIEETIPKLWDLHDRLVIYFYSLAAGWVRPTYGR